MAALLSRRLVTAHGRLVTHLQYVHVGEKRRVVYNGLGFVKLVVMTLNLATAISGSLLCGYQYWKSWQLRYVGPFEFEEELRARHQGGLVAYGSVE